MSDDNVISFKDLKDREDSNDDRAKSVQERLTNCYENRAKNGKCECRYCDYYRNAAIMITDFLAQDITTFENNNPKIKICTHDLKETFFEALHHINSVEENGPEEHEEN